MYTSFLITTDKDTNCGYITVSDISVYSPDTREDYGVALFWSTDSFTSVTGANLDDIGDSGTPGEWFITTANMLTYMIRAFVCPIWLITDPYNSLDVIYHNEVFYYNSSGGVILAGGDTPDINSDWTVIDETLAAGYDMFVNASNVGSAIEYQTTDCPAYTLSKTACKEYTLTDNSSSSGVKHVYVVDYEQNLISSYTLDPSVSTDVAISLDEDGVYIVQVVDGALPDDYTPPANTLAQIPIYEWCDYKSCLTTMIQYILSNCDNPCNDECDDEERAKITRFRHESNKLMALYFTLIGQIHTDMLKNSGIITIDEDRVDFITEVGLKITRLKEILNRCGLCDTDSSTSNSSTNCNCS